MPLGGLLKQPQRIGNEEDAVNTLEKIGIVFPPADIAALGNRALSGESAGLLGAIFAAAATSTPVGKALRGVKALEKVGKAGERLPFPKASRATREKIREVMSNRRLSTNAENLAKVARTETIPLEGVQGFEGSFRGKLSGIGPKGKLPIVIRDKDSLYIWDGNNRIGNLILNGHKTTQARVVDLSKVQ